MTVGRISRIIGSDRCTRAAGSPSLAEDRRRRDRGEPREAFRCAGSGVRSTLSAMPTVHGRVRCKGVERHPLS